MRSMRLRLFLILLATTGAVWLFAVSWTYLRTQHQVERVLDARLTEAARMVSSLIGDHHIDVAAAVDASRTSDAAAAFTVPEGDYNRHLSCQIWSLQGQLVSRSESAPATLLAGHREGFSNTEVDGERWRVYAVVNPALGVRVLVGDSLEMREQLIGDVIKGQLLPAIAILPLLAAFIWLSVGRGLAPLDVLAVTLSRRSADELHSVEDERAPREVRPLLASLNSLFRRVREARDREKTFVAYAAHELKTPLAGLKAQAQIALRSDSDAVRDRALSQISTSVDRTGRLVRQLIDMATVDSVETIRAAEPVDLREMVAEITGELEAARLSREIEILARIPDTLTNCAFDRNLMRLALRNILENAVQYAPRNSQVELSATEQAGVLSIDITDRGAGFDGAEETRILERFYRGSTAGGQGSGLGLSIVRMALARLGGELAFRKKDDGFCVSLALPAAVRQ